MRVYKFQPPYKSGGRCTFPETKKRAGVYLIKENDVLVYVGFSAGDLYKTLYRHFQHWNDVEYRGHKVLRARDRVTYKNKMNRNRYTVRVIICTPNQAARLEKLLIIKHQPRDNSMKYDNYQMDLRDYRVEETYSDCPVEIDAPF